jgi:uncharacterized protein (DUF3820 family)
MSDHKISKVIDENSILLIGKHKGRNVNDVLKTDPSYCIWLKSQPWAQTDNNLMPIICKVKDQGMRWGKHKGKTLDWIILNDMPYIEWLKKNEFVQNNCPDLKIRLDKIASLV